MDQHDYHDGDGDLEAHREALAGLGAWPPGAESGAERPSAGGAGLGIGAINTDANGSGSGSGPSGVFAVLAKDGAASGDNGADLAASEQTTNGELRLDVTPPRPMANLTIDEDDGDGRGGGHDDGRGDGHDDGHDDGTSAWPNPSSDEPVDVERPLVAVHKRPMLTRQHSQIDDYDCPICRSLLCEPVTIQCGHTCCKRCLAVWLKRSINSRCPAGCASDIPRVVPAVNIIMKQKLMRSYGEVYAARLKEVEEAEAAEPVCVAPSSQPANAGAALNLNAAFNVENPQNDQIEQFAERLEHGNPLFTTKQVVRTVCSLLLSAVLFYIGRSMHPAQGVHELHVSNWSVDQVAEWARSNGLSSDAVALLVDHAVDGEVLLELEADDIIENFATLGTKDALALDHLILGLLTSEQHETTPRDFWEYRRHHRFFTTAAVALLSNSPRVGFLMLLATSPNDTLFALFPDARVTLFVGITFSPVLIVLLMLMRLAALNPALTFTFLMTVSQQLDTDFMNVKSAIKTIIDANLTPLQAVKFLARYSLDKSKGSWIYVGVLLGTFPLTPWILSDVIFYAQISGQAFMSMLALCAMLGNLQFIRSFAARCVRRLGGRRRD